MTGWDSYPADYRGKEVRAALAAARAGECTALLGLSGSGKSNMIGFLANRQQHPVMALVDGNRARPRTSEGLLALALRSLEPGAILAGGEDALGRLEAAVERRLSGAGGLCLLFDRLDALDLSEQLSLGGALRALRDSFKYRLAYITATRRPLDPGNELAELFYAHTLWLGPLQPSDATWSARTYGERQGLDWGEETLHVLARLSWGYPSLLRACCEAHAQGCALEEAALRAHPSVRRRVEEFWADQPSPEELRLCGLEGHPLLREPTSRAAEGVDSELTALEHRLLVYFQAHRGEVCAKDDLIRAVWPEDRLVDGLRDDSLAQLVRRLRQKMETDPARPLHIVTVTGRGYRYQ